MLKPPAIELDVEESFLLIAARYQPTDQELAQAIDLGKKIKNWQRLEKMTDAHSVGPLLYENFSDKKDIFPRAFFEKLEKDYYSNQLYSWKRFEHLQKILLQLNGLGIAPLILKGVSMANFYYHTPALRPMADIDLLVEKDQIREVEKVLLQAGGKRCHELSEEYIRKETTNELTPIYFAEINCHYDIHFDLLPPPYPSYFSVEALKDEMVFRQLGEAVVKTLSPCNDLVFSILHNNKNTNENFGGIFWYNDLRAMNFNKQAKLLEAKYKPISSLIYEYHEFYSEYFNDELSLKKHNNKLLYVLFRGKGKHDPNTSFIHAIRATNSWTERLKKIYHLLFPPLEYMKQRYPAHKTSWLFYIYLHRMLSGIIRILKYLLGK